MWKLVLFVLLSLAHSPLWATEDPLDTYDYQSSCPSSPNWIDANGFAACNCTSYVANKLNQRWSQSPKFVNGSYYTKISTEKWGDAQYWQKKASCVGIGVSGSRDIFSDWNEGTYNAVFVGDVAHWEVSTKMPWGHVAYVEKVWKDSSGN